MTLGMAHTDGIVHTDGTPILFNCIGLASIFAPYLCNAHARAFMSIRHMEDLPALRAAVQVLVLPRFCTWPGGLFIF